MPHKCKCGTCGHEMGLYSQPAMMPRAQLIEWLERERSYWAEKNLTGITRHVADGTTVPMDIALDQVIQTLRASAKPTSEPKP